jgi:hypothetical protein
MDTYLPIKADDLLKHAKAVVDYRKLKNDKDRSRIFVTGQKPSLYEVPIKAPLYVLIHGRFSTANQVGAEVTERSFFGGTSTRLKYLSAAELAGIIERDGLRKAHEDLRLLVCWGAYGRQNGNKFEQPFAAQLGSALKHRGYNRMRVMGFKGSVCMVASDKIIIETGLHDEDLSPAQSQQMMQRAMAVANYGRRVDGFALPEEDVKHRQIFY